jgi:hypothetical protein
VKLLHLVYCAFCVIDRFHVRKPACDAVQKIRIKHRWEAINVIVATFYEHSEEILNFYINRSTNALAEFFQLNNQIVQG